MKAQDIDRRLLDRAERCRVLGTARLRRVAQMQGVILFFFAVDGLILSAYAVLGTVPAWTGLAYALAGWVGATATVAAFRRSRRRVGDLEANDVAMSACSAAVMLATALAVPAIGAPMLMTLMTVISGSALQLPPKKLLAPWTVCAGGATVVLIAGPVPLGLPMGSAGERVVSLAWFVWLQGKSALVNVEGARLRRQVDATNGRLVAALAEVERLARTDELTVIGNRRSIVAELDAALASAHPGADRVAVVLFDIDRFKHVNDSFGHALGDAVLREFAALLSRNLRPDDRVGRYGGEEFLVVLQAVEIDDAARETADRMRRAVEAFDWRAVAPGLSITASAGVAKVGRGEPPGAAVARADRALYRAKAEGRNRVVVC